MLACKRLEAQNFEKTVASPEKLPPARFPQEFQNFKLPARFPQEFQNFKLPNCPESLFGRLYTINRKAKKIAAAVDFAKSEWYSVIFGISTNESY